MERKIMFSVKCGEDDTNFTAAIFNSLRFEKALADIPRDGRQLLIRGVLQPLLKIIYQYKESDAYNKIPGIENTDADPLHYFDGCFNDIYGALNENLYLSQKTYNTILNIIKEIQSFVHSFEAAEGLPERYFRINPNLKFYRVAFADVDGRYLYEKVPSHMLSYVPTSDEVCAKEAYFSAKEKENQKLHLHRDEDAFFTDELAYTLRLVFINDLARCEKTP